MVTECLDPKDFLLPAAKTNRILKEQRPPRHRPGEKFLKGPIPWTWLVLAAQLPGKALHVALVIWFLAGIKRKRTIGLPNKIVERLGVRRNAKYRALNELERACLVDIDRHPGRSPLVTILETEAKNQ